jgi:uncharacterized ion transporter superfamily protein YfcC
MRFPTPHTTLFAVLLLAAAATWLLPAGQYDTLRYSAEESALILVTPDAELRLAPTQATLDSLGMPTRIAEFTEGELTRPVKVPDTYRSLDSSGQSPIALLFAALKGTYDSIDIILLVMMIGGFIRIYNTSGVLQIGIQHLAMRFRGHERWLIILISMLTAAGGTTFGLGEETIAFYPILVPILLAAGYDRLVPVAVIFAGSQFGIMASTVNPFSVIIASDAAGVSWDSGIAIRIAMLVLGLIALIWYTIRYAERVRKNPALSYISDEERNDVLPYSVDIPSEPVDMTWRHKAMLTVFGLTFVTMIAGITFFGWWMLEMTALFLASGVVSGLLLGLDEKTLVHEFVAGASEMVGVALIIGLARGVTVIMNDGRIIDTVLYGASTMVAGMPDSIFLVALIGVFFVLGFLISSTSGLALVTMPILGALAVSNGIPGESIVTSYAFGAGLMLLIGPTGLVLPSLAMVNLKLSTWLRFILPLMGILALIAAALLVVGG